MTFIFLKKTIKELLLDEKIYNEIVVCLIHKR